MHALASSGKPLISYFYTHHLVCGITILIHFAGLLRFNLVHIYIVYIEPTFLDMPALIIFISHPSLYLSLIPSHSCLVKPCEAKLYILSTVHRFLATLVAGGYMFYP